VKATLHFDLDEPGEKLAHIRAIKATDAYLALYTLLNCFTEEKTIITLDEVNKILDEYNINVWEELE